MWTKASSLLAAGDESDNLEAQPVGETRKCWVERGQMICQCIAFDALSMHWAMSTFVGIIMKKNLSLPAMIESSRRGSTTPAL